MIEITRPPLVDTFELPAREELLALQDGDYVKLIFNDQERMWVEIIDCSDSKKWVGALNNNPVLVDAALGDFIEFNPLDVIGIMKNSKNWKV